MILNIPGSRFFLLILFVAMVSVPGVVNAANTTSGEDRLSNATAFPVIFFEGLSTLSDVSYNASEQKIHSIKKYDLLIFDIPKLREKLAKNETITVRINGEPFEMALHDSTGNPIGLDPAIKSYSGNLKNVKNSDAGFTIDDSGMIGQISINHTIYSIDIAAISENGNVVQYVYSSKDVVREGPSVNIDDVDVTRRSPVTTKYPEEPPASKIPSETQRASPSILIPGIAVGLIVLFCKSRR
jgi:hypothetical protein